MAIEKPSVGAVGVAAVDFVILIDPKNMELPGSDAQTTPTGGIRQMEITRRLFQPITLEEFLQRAAP